MTDIIVLLACAFCGFAVGKYLERRVRCKKAFFEDANKYIELFKVNISGRQLEVNAFNEEFGKNYSGAFAEYVKGVKGKFNLTSTEKLLLDNFFQCLNAVSSQELQKQLDFNARPVKELAVKYSEQSSKASIYPKLGLLMGVMAGIVLI